MPPAGAGKRGPGKSPPSGRRAGGTPPPKLASAVSPKPRPCVGTAGEERLTSLPLQACVRLTACPRYTALLLSKHSCSIRVSFCTCLVCSGRREGVPAYGAATQRGRRSRSCAGDRWSAPASLRRLLLQVCNQPILFHAPVGSEGWAGLAGWNQQLSIALKPVLWPIAAGEPRLGVCGVGGGNGGSFGSLTTRSQQGITAPRNALAAFPRAHASLTVVSISSLLLSAFAGYLSQKPCSPHALRPRALRDLTPRPRPCSSGPAAS